MEFLLQVNAHNSSSHGSQPHIFWQRIASAYSLSPFLSPHVDLKKKKNRKFQSNILRFLGRHKMAEERQRPVRAG
jgi:hypothetical protein